MNPAGWIGWSAFVVVGVLLIIETIRHKRECIGMKAELHQLTESLEDKMRQRTAELETSQNRIRQSEKMSALGKLASGVAHEINNPLGVILGFSEGALRRVAEGDVLHLPLQSIQREALRCKNLVQDLLTFSRASKAEREPMDFNQTVEGALTLIQAKARMTQVTIQRQLAPHLPSLEGNANQIQQIVINLSTNALDAMEGRGALTIQTELLPEGPLSWIALRIRDTGSGIPQDILPHIFEPFYTTKSQGQGTGLGLALVQEIIRKHSALMNVESRPGCTEFCIKFPVRTGNEGQVSRGSLSGSIEAGNGH